MSMTEKGVRIFTSNRMENLSEALAAVLRTPLGSPFAEEIIVVQSKGMEHWISMELAARHGIAANYAFPFPNAFVRDIFRKVIPDIPERSPFDPDVLTWRIMKKLADLLGRPGFESLKIYLKEKGYLLKKFQLSERIADLFDQYLLFRPEMIKRWEKGKGTHWQAMLWRELVRDRKGKHRADLAERFHERLLQQGNRFEGFPERVAVFGISALPRFYLQILASLSRCIEVNLFLMNPCREYWGDILSSREMTRARKRGQGKEIPEKDLHLERGNSLLASMGALGRDFFELVQELNGREVGHFVDPRETCLLRCLQSDILNLRERNERGEGKTTVSLSDDSLQIHACHSPAREMEVLRDRLLDLFERDDSLVPRDILIMTPDIEIYAPYIRAVFDVPKEDPTWIPFSIADRSLRRESGIIETFLSILDLRGGRYDASRVLALLESTSLQRRFGILEEDLEDIRRWVKETGIRWGIHEGMRKELGLPGFRENTWEAGQERALLGYALPGREVRMFGGLLPYDRIEGSQARILGRFIEFTSRLFDATASLETPRSPGEWARSLTEIVDSFFMADHSTEKDLQALRRAILDLSDTAAQEGFDFQEPVDLPLIRWYLGRSFEKRGFGLGFLQGGLTFCAMLPMRSIPFRIICLVGMNGDAYPRQQRPLGFDLMARRPRTGDRSRREDDRYLFLEALLSARNTLYISYVGQDIRDNTPIPPSILVSELMDCVEQGFEIHEKTMEDHLLIRHRLQPFSPAYFEDNPRLFSYSREDCEVARTLLAPSKTDPRWMSGSLPEPEKDWRTLEIEDLCRFFSNPARYLLQRRLGIHLEEKKQILEDKEVFELKGLERYLLLQDLLRVRLEGGDLRERWSLVKASGRLPHGNVGESVYGITAGALDRFAQRIQMLRDSETLRPLAIDLSVSGFRIRGLMDPLYPERLLHYRFAALNARDLLRTWIHHLVLNSSMGQGYPRTSLLAGLDPANRKDQTWMAWEFGPVEEADHFLAGLLDAYWKGICAPLRFFPEASLIYADAVLMKNLEPGEALIRAERKWQGGEFSRGEREDAYYRLCFKGEAPMDSEFRHLSGKIFGPLLAHRRGIGVIL